MEVEMKINYTPKVVGTTKTYGKKTGKATKVKRSLVAKDEMSISSSAKDVQLASKAIKNVPDVRVDKIKALKEQIDNGTYNVSAIDIADKMIEW